MSRSALRGRRRHATTAVAIAATAAALITACSPPADEASSDGGGLQSVEQPEVNADAFPVTITHAMGETTIDSAPSRVAAMGVGDADNLLALGFVPTTVASFGAPPALSPWVVDAISDLGGEDPVLLANASNAFGDEIAKTLATDPDLITAIGADPTQEQYDTLTEAVNTIVRPADSTVWQVPWQDQVREIGRAVGQEDVAEEKVEDTESVFADVRANNNFEGKTGVVISATPTGVSILSPEDGRGQTLASYGFEFPEELREHLDAGFYGEISNERLDLLEDVDVIVVLDWDGSNDALEANPAWQGLPAAREGRVAYVNQEIGTAMSVPTVLSIPWVAERIVPIIAEATE